MTLIEHTNFPNSQHHRALWSERSIVIPHKWHSEKFPHRNIICNIPPYIMHFSQLFSSLQRWSFWHRSAETCTAICAKRGGENDGRWNKKKRSEWMTKWLLTWWYGWEMMLMVERANERTGRSNRNADVHEHKQFFIVHMGFSPTTLFWLHFKKHT